MKKFLLYGSSGWIGTRVLNLLAKRGYVVVCGRARTEDRETLQNEIVEIVPDRIINCSGKTGRPNIDWCESHPQETIRANVIGTLNLCDLAHIHNVHLTHFATGCIYKYDQKHPCHSGIGFTEEDIPNFSGSFYSESKIYVENLIKRSYPSVCVLRLRMPISDDLHPRSFVTKITKYEKVVNIPNSMSILHDLLPLAIDMSRRKIEGIWNFVNPGCVSHNQVLDLYKEFIDPTFRYTNFSEEEQQQVLVAERSNNELNASKLLNLYPNIPNILVSLRSVFERMSDQKES